MDLCGRRQHCKEICLTSLKVYSDSHQSRHYQFTPTRVLLAMFLCFTSQLFELRPIDVGILASYLCFTTRVAAEIYTTATSPLP